MRLLELFLVSALSLIASAAFAQPPTPTNDQLARQAFEAGGEAFNQGDYETALRRFQEAYELSHRAELLYNIAQSLDRLRRDQETLTALRRYLEAAPNTRSRPEVEARITVLQRAIDQRQAEDQERRRREDEAARQARDRERLLLAQRREGAPPPQRPPLHPAIFITVAALAVGGGGLAVWTGLETMSLNDAYNASNDLDEARRLYGKADTYQTATNILIFSSAGLGAAAIIMAFFTDWGGGATPETQAFLPTLDADPNGAMLGARGRF